MSVSPIEQIDVAGVPTFAVEAPGHTHVGIAFGVGAADEPLPVRGVSHLCEHLVLSDLARRDHPYNGAVGWNTTEFFAAGTEDEVVTFVNEVATRLTAVPVDRLDKEVAILSAEAGHRQLGTIDLLLMQRFGARSFGRAGYDEYGLFGLDAHRIRAWATSWFHADNAALWIVAPDPATVGSRLELPLPAGRPMPTPRRDLTPVTPLPQAVADDRVGGPSVSFVVRRTVAMKAAFALLNDELSHEIRHERALAYEVVGTYIPLDADTVHAHLGADTLPARTVETAEVLIAALERFADRGPRAEAVDRYRDMFTSRPDDLDVAAQNATDQALELVLGEPLHEHAPIDDQLDALTPATIAEAFRAALPAGLALVPPGTRTTRQFPFAPPRPPTTSITGTTHRPTRRRGGPEKLVVGPGGVGWLVPSQPALDIPAADCELVLTWDDGQRLLFGADGTELVVEPWMWRDSRRLVEKIDDTMPAAARVRVGPGDGGPPRRWLGDGSLFVALSTLALTAIVITGLSLIGLWLDRRERAIEARSDVAMAEVVQVDDDELLLEYEIEDDERQVLLAFSPSDVEGRLEVGERTEVLVDRRSPTSVHLPGNTTALLGAFWATMVGASPLVVLVLLGVTAVAWYRFIRRWRARRRWGSV